jgi:hypothetical protein
MAAHLISVRVPDCEHCLDMMVVGTCPLCPTRLGENERYVNMIIGDIVPPILLLLRMALDKWNQQTCTKSASSANAES